MKTTFHHLEKRLGQRGAVAIIVAISLPIFLGVAALAIDVGYLLAARNELQNAADAAALAATRQLGEIYKPKSYAEQQVYVCGADDQGVIRKAATDVAKANKAATVEVTLADTDIQIGTWTPATKTFAATYDQPDAVRVTALRDGADQPKIGTFFAKIFGMGEVGVSATATAALTSLSKMEPGIYPPVGISKKWFEKPEFCNQPIKFHPTGTLDGCAGWHTYTSPTHSADQLKEIIERFLPPELRDKKYASMDLYLTPEIIATFTELNFTGGDAATAFSNFMKLFDYMKTHDDDGDDSTWTTMVPVYNYDSCDNPKNDIVIVGFATTKITKVVDSPDKLIEAVVLCDNVEPGRGSGGNYGTKGTIPGLVQ